MLLAEVKDCLPDKFGRVTNLIVLVNVGVSSRKFYLYISQQLLSIKRLFGIYPKERPKSIGPMLEVT